MGGVIGMSCREIFRFADTCDTLVNLDKPSGTSFRVSKTMHGPANWNEQIKKLLREGKEWLFFTEDDHNYPADTLLRLLARNVDIVGGLYLMKQMPFAPILYEERPDGTFRHRWLRDDEHGLIEVDACGVGCLVVRRRVFEAMPEPWFVLTNPPASPDTITGDFEFCRAARRAGFKVWCDLDTPVEHIAVVPIRPVRKNGRWQTFLRCGGNAGVFVETPQRMLGFDEELPNVSDQELAEMLGRSS